MTPRIHSRFALSLVRAGYEVIVICRIPNDQPRSVRIINNVKYVCVPRPRYAKWDIIQTLKLFIEAWRVKATIFICFEIRTLLMGLILKSVKRVKIIYDCHEYKAEVYGVLLPIPLRETTTFLIHRQRKRFQNYAIAYGVLTAIFPFVFKSGVKIRLCCQISPVKNYLQIYNHCPKIFH